MSQQSPRLHFSQLHLTRTLALPRVIDSTLVNDARHTNVSVIFPGVRVCVCAYMCGVGCLEEKEGTQFLCM